MHNLNDKYRIDEFDPLTINQTYVDALFDFEDVMKFEYDPDDEPTSRDIRIKSL